MLLNINWEDNQTPPGFAVVVHNRPHQLIATLACHSLRAKLYRLQLLAHAYQQPASEEQVHHQQPASLKPAQPNATHVLAINMKIHNYGKEERDMCMFSRCFAWHSLATAELIQHVILLIWQALLGAICDRTTEPKHAGIDDSVWYALIQL